MPPSDSHTVVRTSNRDLAAMPFDEALEVYSPNLADALPAHIPLQRFKRVLMTAVNQNPDLARCDRRSLFNACVTCALDGLYPDGREAVLLTFDTKQRDGSYKKVANYIPMIAGIRKRMRNSGEVLSATAEVVHKNDRFHYAHGENPCLEHEPPPLDQDRGPAVGAYAIIKLLNGETIREVMGLHEIERIRGVSRSGQRADSPWVKSWGEMARKTALKRAAKAAPITSELERLLARDEAIEHLGPPPPRPTREQFYNAEDRDADDLRTPDQFADDHTGQGPGQAVSSWNLIDADGVVVHSYDDPDEAADAMVGQLKGATTLEAFEALIPMRTALVAQFADANRDDLETEIMQVPRPEPLTSKRKETTAGLGGPTQTQVGEPADLSGEHSGGNSTTTAARSENSAMPRATGSVDLFTQTDRALRTAAAGGLKSFQKAWLATPQQQKDLVKPTFAEYEQLAREAGV